MTRVKEVLDQEANEALDWLYREAEGWELMKIHSLRHEIQDIEMEIELFKYEPSMRQKMRVRQLKKELLGKRKQLLKLTFNGKNNKGAN